MFRSVKFLKPKERKKREKKESKPDTPTTEESSTDSDDYQTVYSQKIEVPQKYRPKAYNLSKRKTHSKISYKHVYQRDKSPEKFIRRSPYMEQEYRKLWNEKLMFHDSKYPKHLSEHPYAQRYPGEFARKVNPYYQTYEARAAMLEPRILPKNDGMYAKRVPPKQIKNQGNKIEPKMASKAVPWLKKHKLGNIRCGEHFRQLINEN